MISMLYAFKTRDTEISLDQNGFISSINVCGEEVALGKSPIVTVCKDDELYLPEKAQISGNNVIVTTAVGDVCIAFCESDVCVTFEIVSVPENTYAVIFGPVTVNINEVYCKAEDFDIFFNTVPKTVVDSTVLKKIKDSALLIELASKPFGIDMEAAERLGKSYCNHSYRIFCGL